MSILEYLKSLNAYPIPEVFLKKRILGQGLDVEQEITKSVLDSKELKLLQAEVYDWLSLAPNISQGGQNYSFDDSVRGEFKKLSKKYAEEGKLRAGEESRGLYGYKGGSL